MSLHRRLTLILGFSQLLVWALTYYIPAVTTVAVAGEWGVGAAWVLGGFSVALLVTGLASPAACRWIDRWGGRPVLLGGVVVQAAGMAVMAGAGGLPQWYAGWALVGLGMAGGLYDAAFATAGRALGAAARPTITGITMIAGFASTIGWPVGAALVPLLGWRMTLLTYAAVLLAVNVPLFLLLPLGVPPAPAAVAGPALPATGGRWLFAWIAAFFTIRAGFGAVISVSGLVLLQGLGLGTAAAVGIIALIGPAQVGMRVLQSVAGPRWTPVAITWVGAAVVPVVTLPVAWAGGSGWAALAATVFALGYGASNGILTIARGTLPLHLFGPAGYATRIGQLALPVILAQAAAPLLSAPLLNGWPAETVFLVLAAVSMLAAGCLWPLLARRAPR